MGIGLFGRIGRGVWWGQCMCGWWGGFVVAGFVDLVVGIELRVEGEIESVGWVESELDK